MTSHSRDFRKEGNITLVFPSPFRLDITKLLSSEEVNERVCGRKMFLKTKGFKDVQLTKDNNKINNAVNENILLFFWIFVIFVVLCQL